MKIERLGKNQIRCTLNKSDLASRQLKISELAYGSDKAKELFRDMMQQASRELGFEADDIPLMIEAIPISSDCIVLIVTKVEDPEELDTRFSKFSPSSMDEDYEDYPYGDDMEVIESDNYSLPTARDELEDDAYLQGSSAEQSLENGAFDASKDDVVNLFSKVKDYLSQSISDLEENHTADAAKPFVPLGQTLTGKKTPANDATVIRVFLFPSLDAVTEAAHAVLPVYEDFNSLYKGKDGQYYLVLKRTKCSANNFNKTCNILSEFGTRTTSNPSSLSFFDEHEECIVKRHAIQVLAKL